MLVLLIRVGRTVTSTSTMAATAHDLHGQPSMNLEASHSPSRRPERDPARPARILVADDDADLLELVSDALREDGYEVVEEHDGGRLLVRIAAVYAPGSTVEPIDLIVSDVCMPVCSGLDVLVGLRNARWATPVILMTAYGDPDVRARASHLGALLLEKPFEASDLREKVKAMLASARQRG